ncbi:hypothetical protein ACU4GD_30600 [Cupriavidus basilensis]
MVSVCGVVALRGALVPLRAGNHGDAGWGEWLAVLLGAGPTGMPSWHGTTAPNMAAWPCWGTFLWHAPGGYAAAGVVRICHADVDPGARRR